jgi:hypothetical protein
MGRPSGAAGAATGSTAGGGWRPGGRGRWPGVGLAAQPPARAAPGRQAGAEVRPRKIGRLADLLGRGAAPSQENRRAPGARGGPAAEVGPEAAGEWDKVLRVAS